MILQTNEDLPAVPRRPAPWNLEGDAYVIGLHLPPESPALRSQLPSTLSGRAVRAPSYLMYVDYVRSDCGPYRELLFIPGALRFGDRRCGTIGRIYVSTFESVVNGRANWGIPKDRAEFLVERGVDGTSDERIRVQVAGEQIAELRVRASKLALPITSRIIPKVKRTLAHHWEGKTYFTTPEVSGRVARAEVVSMRFGTELFPDVSAGVVLGAVQLRGFRMTFPVATLEPGIR